MGKKNVTYSIYLTEAQLTALKFGDKENPAYLKAIQALDKGYQKMLHHKASKAGVNDKLTTSE